MKETANRGKGKTLLISAGIEIMLIICIMAANLNPMPILYFILVIVKKCVVNSKLN